MKPILSNYAKQKKIDYFFANVPKSSKILEVGCGSKWLGKYLINNGWENYTGLDLCPPADILGSIKDWRKIGLKKNSFDIIVAFEVIEHIDCFREFSDLLKKNGLLFLTSPVPRFDWFLKILEIYGLNQKRTTPHNNLIYFENITLFKPKELKTIAFLSQWGKFKKIYSDKPDLIFSKRQPL